MPETTDLDRIKDNAITESDEPALCGCEKHYLGAPCPTTLERLEQTTTERHTAQEYLDHIMGRWFSCLVEARSEGRTLAEVGKAAGITGERVRQLLVVREAQR